MIPCVTQNLSLSKMHIGLVKSLDRQITHETLSMFHTYTFHLHTIELLIPMKIYPITENS